MATGNRERPSREAGSLSAAAASVRPKTILVAEDEVLIRLMIADELRRAGFVVIEAANADEAMRILQTPTPVDLIITDIQMPGSIDGQRFAALARSNWPQTKVVIVSAYAPTWPTSSVVHTFIGKPFNPDRLVERVRELLRANDDRD